MRRRDVLVGAGRGVIGLALISLTAGTTVACGRDSEPEVDPLQAPYDLASSDAELARTAATTAPPTLVAALTQVASERAQHARALAEEIARVAGRQAPTSTESTSPAATTETTTSATATPPASAADVSNALRAAAESATNLAPTLTGYRAGLLGSIAAACTASFTVALPNPKAAS